MASVGTSEATGAVEVQQPSTAGECTQQQHEAGDPLPVQAVAAPVLKRSPLIASSAIDDNLDVRSAARMARPGRQ
jgi:hypothetical protein